MSRVTDALHDWPAPDAEQQALRELFIDYAQQHSNSDDRDCLPDHITASALVVDDTGEAVLLGLHRKVGLWLQFGGHVEPSDSSLIDAALREAREESGVSMLTFRSQLPTRLDVHAAPCSVLARHHLDVQYTAVTSGRPPPRTSEESIDVRWFSVHDLPHDTDDAVRRLVAASIQ